VRGRRALIAKLFFDGYARDLLPSRAVLVTTPRKG
jgi:hypothetical protein